MKKFYHGAHGELTADQADVADLEGKEPRPNGIPSGREMNTDKHGFLPRMNADCFHHGGTDLSAYGGAHGELTADQADVADLEGKEPRPKGASSRERTEN